MLVVKRLRKTKLHAMSVLTETDPVSSLLSDMLEKVTKQVVRYGTETPGPWLHTGNLSVGMQNSPF